MFITGWAGNTAESGEADEVLKSFPVENGETLPWGGGIHVTWGKPYLGWPSQSLGGVDTRNPAGTGGDRGPTFPEALGGVFPSQISWAPNRMLALT